MRNLFGAALAAVIIGAPALAAAADFDGSKPLICSTMEAHDCSAGDNCARGLPDSVGAPQFLRIDFVKQIIMGPKRSTPIKSIIKDKDQLILQGVELNFGWTLAIDTETGALTSSIISHEAAVVVFGACTPL